MAGQAGNLDDFGTALERGLPALGTPLGLPAWETWLAGQGHGSGTVAASLHRLGRSASLSLRAALAVAADALAMATAASAALPGESVGVIVAGSNLQLARAWQAYEKFRAEPAYLSPRYGYEFYDTHVMAVLAEAFGLRGPGATVGGASASGNVAILNALDLVRQGRVAACLVVGPLPELSPVEWHALSAMGALAPKGVACRPFDRSAAGFVPGEACAALVVESEHGARTRGALALAELAGAWSGLGGSHLPDPDIDSEVRAMSGALSDAGADLTDLDYVSAHATSTPAGDAAECEALRRFLAGRAREVPVNATKSLVGHALQAAGVVELVALVLQMRGGFVHGTAGLDRPIADDLWLVGPRAVEHRIRLGLSNSFGFGSIATCVAVRSIEGS